MNTTIKQLSENFIYKGVQITVGVIILIFAHIVGKFVSNAIYNLGKLDTRSFIKKEKDGPTASEQKEQVTKVNLIFATLGKISYYAIIIITFFIVLRIIGIESTSLIALLGAAGFAIGLAIQGTLSDLASGILIALLQTYSIGEIIEIDNTKGKVVDFTILNTVISDYDTGVNITIPNRKIQDSVIINHTRNPIRYVIYDYVISNKENDTSKVISAIKAYLFNVEKVIKDPEPEINVEEVSSSGTKIRVKVPIYSKDLEELEDTLRTQLRQVLIDNKIPLKE